LPIVVALASLAVWAAHFEGTFQDDDFHIIVKNRALQDLSNVPHFFTTPLLFADQPEYAQYRPLALVSLALDYQLANALNPGVFAIDSFAWFLLSALLFAVLCAMIPGRNWRSALLAIALFAFHPVTGETLNYFSYRGNLIGAACLLAGFAFWMIWPRYLPAEIMHWKGVPKTDWDNFKRRWSPPLNATYRRFVEAPLGLYLIPVIIGMFADPGVAVFPLLLLAYILLFDNAPGMPAPWRRVLPAAAVCSVFWIAQVALTWKYSVGFRIPAPDYWITEPWVITRYFLSFFFPVGLTVESGLQTFPHFWSPLALAGFAGLAALIVLARYLGSREGWQGASFGLWWFLIALLPTLLVPQRAAESDARVYLALFGLALGTARAASLLYLRVSEASSNKLRTAVIGASVAGVLVAVLCILTFERNEVWKTEIAFWEDAIAKNPKNGRAFVEYSAALNAVGQTDRGYDNLQRGAALISGDAPDQVRLARAFDQINKDKEAEDHFKRAIAASPNYASAWSAYSQWLIIRRRAPEAYQAAMRAAQLSPWNTEAQHTLLQFYSDSSDWPNLRKTAAAVLLIDPTDVDARRSQSVAQAAYDAVTVAEEKAKREPSVDDFLSLSVQYYRTRRFEDSIKACQEALKITPDLGEAYSNMAAAYYALGKKDEAIQALRETIRIRPDLQVARRNLDFLMSLKADGQRPALEATP
jgi:tetratricopeptide (TPR) repeat protein